MITKKILFMIVEVIADLTWMAVTSIFYALPVFAAGLFVIHLLI